MNRHKPYLFISFGIMLGFLTVAIVLDHLGTRSRVIRKEYLFDNAQVKKWTVDYPDQAYYVWKENGFKGRVILSVSRRLNFVSPQSELSIPLSGVPLEQVFEQVIKPENFLRVAMNTGIAREIVHLLPRFEFDEQFSNATNKSEATAANGIINAPYFGSPRTITTLPLSKPPKEPVLLFINASIFRDYTPEELHKQLVASGINADAIIYCRSLDDKQISDEERARLRDFELMMGGMRGKA